jgi:hypothetical protein
MVDADNDHQFLRRVAEGRFMRWDRDSLTAFGGIAALVLWRRDAASGRERGVRARHRMVGGIGAMALPNHERLKLATVPPSARLRPYVTNTLGNP